jgi:histidyl-tRNA synthetase
MNAAGVDDPATRKAMLRVLDKLGKIGERNVRLELGKGRMDDSGDPIRGAGLPDDVIDRVIDLILVTGSTRSAVVDALARQLPSDETTAQALDEMRELDQCLQAQNVSELDVVYRPSLARGLDYYTGPIFEAYVCDAPEIGAVIGGGRYDRLVDRFLEKKIPATGASFGLDRFAAVLRRLGKGSANGAIAQALVVSIPGVPSPYLLSIAHQLRTAGIRTEVYFGEGNAKLSDQLSAANLRHVPVAVIVGPDEYRANQASVKDLRAGLASRAEIGDRTQFRQAGKAGQTTVGLSELSEAVKAVLA